MFSFGWSEIALTVIIIVIVVGPKEIPNLLKQIGSFSKSIKKISREFKKSLNDIAEESDLKDVKDSISEIKNIKKDLDPTQEIKKDIETIKDTAEVFEKEIFTGAVPRRPVELEINGDKWRVSGGSITKWY